MAKSKKKVLTMSKTKYNIPTFSYKDALKMLLVFFICFNGIPLVLSSFKLPFIWPTIIIGSIISGYFVSYTQFKKKKPLPRSFWWVGAILSFGIGLLSYFLFVYRILL